MQLIIGAYIKRNDYRDVIISKKIKSLEDLKGKIVIGSSSKEENYSLKLIKIFLWQVWEEILIQELKNSKKAN